MNTIARLETKVDRFQRLLNEEQQRYPEPDFAAELQMSSLRSQLQQFQRELREAKAERKREIVEVRFMRDDLFGQLRLKTLGVVAQNLADALHAAAHYLRSNKGRGGKIPESIISTLDLQMVGLRPGSSRLVISGELSPNLFGESLLQKSLLNTFNLFQADRPEDLTEAVSTLGVRSMRRLRDLLDEVADEGFEMELAWNTPHDERKMWHGDRETIRRLRATLNEFETTEPETLRVTGTLYSISLGGRFAIKTSDSVYKGRFPDELERRIRQLRVGQKVEARLEALTYVNDAMNVAHVKYTLTGIEAVSENGLTQNV